MYVIRKYSKTHHFQKQNYVTVWKKENCPMRWTCLSKNFLYYARISCDDETYKSKLYKGICETTFKRRYANHENSFNAEKKKNDTKASTEYWKLANNKLPPRIFWSIKGNYKLYNPTLKRCSLCSHKKLEIVNDPG